MWVAYMLLLCPIKMGSVSGVWKFVVICADIHTMGTVSTNSFIHSLYIHTILSLACMHLYVHMYVYFYSSPFPACC